MTTKTEFEQSLSTCYRALKLILDKQTLAIPRNYDVWYNYASGDLLALVTAIDEHLAVNDSITQKDIDEFYDRYICPVGKLAASEEIGTKICGEVTGISEKLAFATSKTREYRTTLTETSGRLRAVVDPVEIRAAVQSIVTSTRDIEAHNAQLEHSLESTRIQVTQLNMALAALQVETRTDSLTGLANRKKFTQDLDGAIKGAEATGTELCLLLGDIDNFKKFNDIYGHQTGDDVLKEAARVLGSSTKNRDLVARYGGEEFALILPKTNLSGAVTIANRIRSALTATRMVNRRDGTRIPPITMSFGAVRHRTGDSVEDFVDRADACLYAAKKAGRNCVKMETEVDLDRNTAVA